MEYRLRNACETAYIHYTLVNDISFYLCFIDTLEVLFNMISRILFSLFIYFIIRKWDYNVSNVLTTIMFPVRENIFHFFGKHCVQSCISYEERKERHFNFSSFYISWPLDEASKRVRQPAKIRNSSFPFLDYFTKLPRRNYTREKSLSLVLYGKNKREWKRNSCIF